MVEIGKGLLGAQVGFLNYDHKYTTNPLKNEEKDLIKQNIANTTLYDQNTAKIALDAALNLHGNADYKSSPTPGIKAVQDLTAPSFYDISDFPKKFNPLVKPLGIKTQADRTTYRFRLSDIARADFNYTGMPLNGVTKVETAQTGIKSSIQDRALVLTITNPPKKILLERIKNPLTLLEPQEPGLNSEWIRALSKLPKVITSAVATKNPNEMEYVFSITEEDWQTLDPADKVNFLYKTTTSGPAKKQIKKNFAPFLIYAQAEELQPPHPIKGLLSTLTSIPEAVISLITIPLTRSSNERAQKKEQILKPIKSIAETLNLRNIPKVLQGLSFARKVVYLSSKIIGIPLNFIPIIGKKFDIALIKILCKQEIAARYTNNLEKKIDSSMALKQPYEALEKTKQIDKTGAVVQLKHISKNISQTIKQSQEAKSKAKTTHYTHTPKQERGR